VNTPLIANFLGWLLVGLAAIQSVPIAAALFFGEPALPYAASAIAAGVVGLAIALGSQPDNRRMRTRDGFLVVSAAWLIASAFGALPYVFTETLGGVDALFESVSGFTTTGSTVMTQIEGAPRALLLWRSLTQWLGGMGIILFAVALMPLLGVGGMQLFKAEVPGPVADKLTPRIAVTARRLWLIYVGFTAVEWVLLVAAGMTGYEALCHSFTTMSTGGFSTQDASIGGFEHALIEWIIIAFMILGGVNFVLHYRLLTGRFGSVLRNAELRYYLLLLGGAAIVVYGSLVDSIQPESFRTALFQVVSIATTTGYATANFENWPALALLVILQLMILGGMAGSTSGGVKSLRVLIGMKALASVFDRLGHRTAMSHPVRYEGKRVADDVLAGIWAFLTAYFLIATAVACVVGAAGYDLVTSLSTALSAVGNVGPGLGEIGPFDNFAHFPSPVKLTLCIAMIAGRLELFTILILFHRDFWRR
jgi:trk system potassium uptake protein TrkH